MADLTALHAALAVYDTPGLLRTVRDAKIPPGVDVLLELATDSFDDLSALEERTGRTRDTLRNAASFYVEQVMLYPDMDAWRVFGFNGPSPAKSLRRRKALLLRWAHPDVARPNRTDAEFAEGAFVRRITEAWNKISSYDAKQFSEAEFRNARKPGKPKSTIHRHRTNKKRTRENLRVSGIIPLSTRQSLWRRFVRRLIGRHD